MLPSRLQSLALASLLGAVSIASGGFSAHALDSADLELAAWRGKLRAADLSERSTAALSLIEHIGEAEEAFPALIQALCDDEALDDVVAARALYFRPRPTADAPALIRDLKTRDSKMRAAAAWELSRVGPGAGDQSVNVLIAALANPDKHERNFVALALATTGANNREAVAALIRLLQDPGFANSPQQNYRYPRATAAIALGMIGAEASPAVPALAEMLAGKSDWEFQRAANCFALGRMGLAASQALPSLRQALGDASPNVRAHASWAIQAISPAGDPAAHGAARSREDDVAVLVRTLTSEPGRINAKIAQGLRVLGEFAGAAKPVAKQGSRKSAPPVHESISLALGYLDSLSQPPSTKERAGDRPSETEHAPSAAFRQYVMALGGVQQGIAPVLLETLTQGEGDPRVRAIRRLGALGPTARHAVPALREALYDADWLVRREAFFALRSIQSPKDRP